MRFNPKKHSPKKRSHIRQMQSADSRVQAYEQHASIERHPALPADPVFDLFLTRQEQMYGQTLAFLARQAQTHRRMKDNVVDPERAIACSITLIHSIAWRNCEHIFLSPGVVAMLDEIVYDPDPHGLPERLTCHLPSPAWIKIEEEFNTPFYEHLDFKIRGMFILNVFAPDNLALLKKQPFARQLERTLDQAFVLLRDFVAVQLIGAQGECLFKLEFQQSSQTWRIAGEHLCPYHACVIVAGRCQQPCRRCEMAREMFSRWFPICVLALQGRFRQIEQERSPETAPMSGNRPGKAPSPPIRVVRTIDVSVKPARKTDGDEAEAPTEAPRGSWVERARSQNADLVKDEKREVPERTRTLKHPRYRNYIEEHGNKVTVKAHTRTVHLLNLPRTTRARARRYGDAEPK